MLDIKVVKAPLLEVKNRFPRRNAVLKVHGAYFIAFIIQHLVPKCIFKLLNVAILYICMINYMIRFEFCASLYDTLLNRNSYYFHICIQIVTWTIIFFYVCVYLTNNFSCNLTADFVCKLCKVKRDVYRIFGFKALKWWRPPLK